MSRIFPANGECVRRLSLTSSSLPPADVSIRASRTVGTSAAASGLCSAVRPTARGDHRATKASRSRNDCSADP